MEETLLEIKRLLSEQLRINIDDVDDDSNILDDLGADSLEVVEMLLSIDSQFGVTVPDDDVMQLKTVRDVAEYIEEHK